MRATARYFFILILMATLAACAKNIPPEALPQNIQIGGTYYTRFALKYEKDRYRTTNYRRGFLLPINSKVTLVAIDSKSITVRVAPSGKELLIENVPKHTGEDVFQAFNKLFSPTPVNLSQFNTLERKNIETGTVEPGMRRKAVIAAIGYPPSVGTPSLQSDEWKYWNSRFNTFIVHFKNDVVSAIQE